MKQLIKIHPNQMLAPPKMPFIQTIINTSRCTLTASAFLCLCIPLSSCDKAINAKLEPEPLPTLSNFDNNPGIKLPYDIFLPSSMMGWSLSEETQFAYNEQTNSYVIHGVPVNSKLFDEQGPRFKISSSSWNYQFGFRADISKEEATIGVSSKPAVFKLLLAEGASPDIHLEYSESQRINRRMTVEFKLIQTDPKPVALMRVALR